MSQLATLLFIIGIAGYLYLNRDPTKRASPALWLPTIWLFIGSSRRVSQWFHSGPVLVSADRYLEGNPIDRIVLTLLIVLGSCVLLYRGRQTLRFLGANAPLLLFLLYCAISLVWAEFPGVGAKRLFTTVGDVVMVLIVLTDSDPSLAVKRLLSRLGGILIPISVLLVRYYGDLGRVYTQRENGSWGPVPVGIAENKNTLGLICFVFGVASAWQFVKGLDDKNRSALYAHGAILVMAVWLLSLADSATSTGCFVLGCVLLFLSRRGGMLRRPARANMFVAASLAICVTGLFIVPEMGLLQAIGRDPTLTGRTRLWQDIGSLVVNPVLGTGFENFWLGDRIATLWRIHWWKPNQAHNGYYEVYLNLGIAGLCWLAIVIVRGYAGVVRYLARGSELASLRLTYFVLALVYNLSEAAFKMMNPVWIAFLLAVIVIPEVPEAARRLDQLPRFSPRSLAASRRSG